MEEIAVEFNDQNDKYLPLLMEEMTDVCIFFLTTDGLIASWHGGCTFIKEYEKKDVIGVHYRILYPERLRNEGAPEKHLKEALETGRFAEHNWRLRKSGEEFWAYVILIPIHDKNGKVLGLAKIAQDLTKEYRIKKALIDRNSELDQFAFTVAHDLKAPLRNVKTLTGILSEQSKEDSETITILDDTVKKMSSKIDDILKYSKETYQKAEAEPVDSARLVKEVMAFFKVDSQARLEIEGDLPVLKIPETPFFQVFQNLIDNAIKHNDKDVPVVTVSAFKEGSEWHFIVADNGPGIAEENHETVFEMFKKMPTNNGIDSTGLGLGIVKKIITSRGGKIWIESDPGKGTQFHFTVPE